MLHHFMSRIPRVPLLRDVLLMEPNGKRIIDSPSPHWFREAHAADDRLVAAAAAWPKLNE